MVQNQHYIVKPNGMIKGGNAQYTLDTDSGQISYGCSVQVKILFFTKNYNYSGVYKVNPADLLSSNIKKQGAIIKIEDVRFTVLVATDTQSMVKVEVIGQKMAGKAIFWTSKQYAELYSLDAQATISGFNLNLQLVEVG